MASEALSQRSAGRRVSSVRKPARSAVDHYLSLPYHLLLVRDGEEKGKPWCASVEELTGCTSRGKTSDDALNGVRAAMTAWIETALQEGRDVPEPKSATSHSGRLLLRMPRTLHADLTRASEREGVSLNQFITDVLASAVAWRAANGPPLATSPVGTTPLSQAPGAESLTTEARASRRSRRTPSQLLLIGLAANFILVAAAAIVAIVVLVYGLM
jgi:antitoxin HicB